MRDGRMVSLDLTDQFAGALGFASALSLSHLLDHEVDALAAAVDGDAETPVERHAEPATMQRDEPLATARGATAPR